MDKEEPNFNIWEKFLKVSWCLKLQRWSKTAKNNQKSVSSRMIFRETSQETKNKCHCKKQMDHNFPWSTLL